MSLSIEFEVSAVVVFKALEQLGWLPDAVDGRSVKEDGTTTIDFKLDDEEFQPVVTIGVYRDA